MQIIGEVVALSGDVHAMLGGEEHVLAQGSPIHMGETILTAQGSSVQIKLADESILAQGENASQTIDSFIFDPANASASSMLVNMAQGTFRMVTGQVGKANPEGIAVKTPLATIGIRGTGIDLDIQGAVAKIGCFLYDGLDVTITTEQGTRFLTAVNTILDLLADGSFGEIRTYSDFEKAFFKAAVPILGLPEDGLYGDDSTDGQAGGGDDDAPDGDGGDGDGIEGDNTDLAQLFAAIFGSEEQPDQTLQELFQALTGNGDGGDTLAGGVSGDTLTGLEGDGDPDDTLPGTGGTTGGEDGHSHGGTHSSVTNGDDDGSTFDTSGITYIHDDDTNLSYLEGTAGSFDELFRGYSGADYIDGKEGSDTLFGGADNDQLFGKDGGDLIVGGTGSDLIVGGGGDDTLWGGSTGDVFRYDWRIEGGDTIKDFQSGIDHLSFYNSSGEFNMINPVVVSAGVTRPASGSSFFTTEVAYTDGVDELSSEGAGFVFDCNDALWYDPNFHVAGDAVRMATVEGDEVQATDILVYAV